MDNTYVMHTNNKHARNTTHVSTCTQQKEGYSVYRHAASTNSERGHSEQGIGVLSATHLLHVIAQSTITYRVLQLHSECRLHVNLL